MRRLPVRVGYSVHSPWLASAGSASSRHGQSCHSASLCADVVGASEVLGFKMEQQFLLASAQSGEHVCWWGVGDMCVVWWKVGMCGLVGSERCVCVVWWELRDMCVVW